MAALQGVVQPPAEIRLRKSKALVQITWADGYVSRLSCFQLRSACACSSCSQAMYRDGKRELDPAVMVTDIQPMGASGLQFFFSDGHSRGHFPWRYLRELPDITGLTEPRESAEPSVANASVAPRPGVAQ